MADLLQSTVDGVDIVAIAGELDIYTPGSLRAVAADEQLLARGRLVLDITGTTFLDAHGLGDVIGVLREIRAHDGAMAVACSLEPALKLFRVTGISLVLPVCETLDEAIAAVREASSRESARPGEKKEDR